MWVSSCNLTRDLYNLHACLWRGIVIQWTCLQGKMRVEFSREMTSWVAGCSQRTLSFFRWTCSIVGSLTCSITSVIGSKTTILRRSTGSRGLSDSGGRSGTFNGRLAVASLALGYSWQITASQHNFQDIFTRYRFRIWEPYYHRKQKNCICILGYLGHAFSYLRNEIQPIDHYSQLRFIIHIYMSNLSIQKHKYCFSGLRGRYSPPKSFAKVCYIFCSNIHAISREN